MSIQNFLSIRQAVLSDATLQEQLRAAPDEAALFDIVLALGRERGCELSEAGLAHRRQRQSPQLAGTLAAPMSDLALEGWVPIRLFWQGTEPLVEWCYLGRERFTHPFFDSTIQLALQRPFNSLFRQHTTMAALG